MAESSKKSPQIIVFIPVRGGSKNIPLKNIKEFAGKPLVYRVLLAAQLTEKIDKIYVSTDHHQIKSTVESFGFSKVQVIGRSEDTATDTASTESAMLEFAAKFNFETIILIQATSPLLTHTDLAKAIEQYQRSGCDSMLSVVRQKRFLWGSDDKQGALPINYDYKARPRRQDFDGYLVENGAFYITSREGLLRTKNRLNGRIELYEMPEHTYYELDEKGDWVVLEAVAAKLKAADRAYLVKLVRTVALDVDGVLTDGGVYCSGSKEELLKFSRVDGKGIELLKKNKVDVWIISAEKSTTVKKRCEKLGVENVFLGVKDKLKCVKELAAEKGLKSKHICFVGDDVQDIPVIEWAGFSAAPKNAVPKVKSKVSYVCSNYGGLGAVREVVDLILDLKEGSNGKSN